MFTLIVEISDENLKSALIGLSPLVALKGIKLYGAVELPNVQNDADELTKIAQKIVEAVRPQPKQYLRKEALQKVLRGHDTFMDQRGESDPVLRNAVGAISKALKVVFPNEKGAVRRLAVPKKTFFADGSYRGTEYVVTPLGDRVRDLLKAEGAI